MCSIAVFARLRIVSSLLLMAWLAQAAFVVGNGPIVPGEWNTSFTKGMEYAKANHAPMVLFWANPGCGNCGALRRACATDWFCEWQARHKNLVMIFDEGGSSKTFARNGSGKYPYICLFWERSDGSAITNRFSGIPGSMPVKSTKENPLTLAQQFAYSIDLVLPTGTESSPTPLVFSEEVQEDSQALYEGVYYYSANLEGGRKYVVDLKWSDTNSVLKLSLPAQSDVNEPALQSVGTSQFTSLAITPEISGTYQILVSAEENAASSNVAFSVSFRAVSKRSIADHELVAELNEENRYSVQVEPGKLHSDVESVDYYDAIADGGLCSVALKAGRNYIVGTQGATCDVELFVYDALGRILARNSTVGGGSQDVQASISPETDGQYYVGLCSQEESGESALSSMVEIESSGASINLFCMEVQVVDADMHRLVPRPGRGSDSDATVSDPNGVGPFKLDRTQWIQTFSFEGRSNVIYRLQATSARTDLSLSAEVYFLRGTEKMPVAADDVKGTSFERGIVITAVTNGVYYVELSVSEGKGLDYPEFRVHASGCQLGNEVGSLTVNIRGADGKWSLAGERTVYDSGDSILVSGKQTVNFSAVKGFSQPFGKKGTNVVMSAEDPVVIDAYYSDTYDPVDDVAKGATAWTIKASETGFTRTLWESDCEDNFSIVGADGVYYDFSLENAETGICFTITNAENGVIVENETCVRQVLLPKTKSKYYLVVRHDEAGDSIGGGYTLLGRSAKVGNIKWAKTSESVKENAGKLKLTVNRTGKEGLVRVKYGTVANTAKPGVDYIAQSGELVWLDGDGKAKTIEIQLIADLVDFYEGDKDFSVRLEPIPGDDRTESEYPAEIVGGDTCAIIVKETVKAGYSPYKAVTVAKSTGDKLSLNQGTFYGLLTAERGTLTNGLPQIGYITVTIPQKGSCSAKIALAGKTYNLTGTLPTLKMTQKVNGLSYENTLELELASEGTDWRSAKGTATVTMNVPDANGKGVQAAIKYGAHLFRDNQKIQDYLVAVTNFSGYYTCALVPRNVKSVMDAPAGYGYLTITVDNKGTAKVVGKLADGTAITCSQISCGIENGVLSIPVFQAKSPWVFGGEIRIRQNAEGELVVDSSSELVWNNDSSAVTFGGEHGYSVSIKPVGGYFDTVYNLQTYYLTATLSVSTVDVAEFPTEALPTGCGYISSVQPNGSGVDVFANAFSTVKQSLVKKGRMNDLEASSNPCNVQIKLARATGLVTGTFSVWSEDVQTGLQKEIKNIKHMGVLLMSRDEDETLGSDVVSAGFFTLTTKLQYKDNGKAKTRSWTVSLPFSVLKIEQESVDWYEDDWSR